VSADTGLTKHSGRQWDVVRERHGPGAILHIGDDAHADLHTPASRGIDALPYLRARSARRTGARLDPAIIPFSLLRRDTVLRARAVLPTPDAPPPADAAWWRDAGRVLGGIVLSAFIRWLEARVRHHRIEALHFLARDGFLLHRAWEASGAAARTGIPGRYLHVSRRTLSLSRGVLASNPDRLDQALLSFLASSDGTLTVSAALSRIGAADDPELRAAAAAEFGDPSTRLAWPDGTGRLERLLSRHAGTIHRRLAGGHALLVRYLRHEGLAAERGRIGIVDLGWHAGMQRSLRAVLEAERGEPASLHGFYYGLWPGALPNLWDAGPAEAAFCGPFRAAGPERGLSEAVEMLEELHTAPHGTVRGYREQDGNVVPVHADSPVERDQYDRITAPFQDGALDTLRRLFTGEAVAGIALDDLSPAAALAALSCVTLSPDPAELRAFGNIRHAATFDHDRFAALIPAGEIPDAEDDRRAALGACGWRFGTLSAWVDRAPPEARAALRAWSSFMLGPSFDPRCKRRFD
ncbi:MAG: hypothetical protein INR65_10140, partial [Gluconacetobacter diazotrophicus]|nr:hypothetical protein [Gluconacetobacter diazotrophicus]